ncbi:MAG: NfeD family protein, partial [Acidimicrobiia bacterium]
PTLTDALKKLDGRTIRRFHGETTILHTQSANVVRIEMSWRQRVLSAIAHPAVAYLLFSLGMLGLTIELWNPGAILPGVVGGLCLLLAFFAFDMLPVNYAGVLLMLFGMALLILEVKVTSFGLLAAGGLLSLVLGSMMLIDAPAPELQVGLRVILPVTAALGAVVIFLVRLAVAAQRRPSVTGDEGMIGQTGWVVTEIPARGKGQVFVRGEYWSATANQNLPLNTPIVVTAVEGLTLHVRRQP